MRLTNFFFRSFRTRHFYREKFAIILLDVGIRQFLQFNELIR